MFTQDHDHPPSIFYSHFFLQWDRGALSIGVYEQHQTASPAASGLRSPTQSI